MNYSVMSLTHNRVDQNGRRWPSNKFLESSLTQQVLSTSHAKFLFSTSIHLYIAALNADLSEIKRIKVNR